MTTTPVMPITDDQIAEIEAQCLKCEQQGGAVLMSSDSLSSLISRLRAAEKDADRYRALREFHWSTSDYAVVRNPKEQVKLGTQCPSGHLLDAAIDAAMEQSK